MKTPPLASLVSISALAAFVLLPRVVSAGEMPLDRAADLLRQSGAIVVNAAGPYVERGTFRIQVLAKLGRPDAVLSDGTWLYQNRRLEGSDAQGTLVLRFEKGRVNELALVTPVVATALRENPQQPLGAYFVATK